MLWTRLRKLFVPAAIAVLAASLVTVAVIYVRFLASAESFVGDVETAAFLPSQPQSPDVVVVALTEGTLKLFPYREPVDRAFLADLLTTLASLRPRAIGLDVLLDQPTEPAKDAALRRAIAELPVPLVVSYVDESEIVDENQRKFLDEFVPANNRVLATVAIDAFDGTARWIYPGHEMPDGTYMPGFARGILAKIGVPTPRQQVEIAWRGHPNAETEPFGEIAAQAVKVLPAALFQNKIVLVGAEFSLTDRHRTPFAAIYEGNRGMLPGIVIHAHSVDQLLTGRRPPDIGAVGNFLVALALASLGVLLGTSKLELHTRIGLGILTALLFWAGGVGLFHYFSPMIHLVTPTLALAAAMWSSEALMGREARRQKEFIQGAFGRYVSPKVVDQLIADPKKLSLEGERREMTFLFTDVAGFTTMSEAIPGPELARVLNAYLDGMCQVIHKYDGTVDKFIGDAVFAIFNAPTDQPDHADRAVRCAVEIDQFSERFRAEQNAKDIPFGITRIGVHSGMATVGNFGSQEKQEYTALGDAVNTASRLEGLNKHFGTRICVSEVVRSQCNGIPFRPIGLVVVKGKTQAIGMYEPLSEERHQAEYMARYRRAFERLEEGAEDARTLFEALHAENPYDGCVEVHLERLRAGARGTEIAMTEK